MSGNNRVIPSHILIEPINGVCTSRCKMCAIHESDRPSHCMSLVELELVLDRFLPYIKQQEFLSFTGLGESLLDNSISQKVAMAKNKGFVGIGMFTNCTELNPGNSSLLLNAGLGMIGVAIDGARKETHEAIRVGTSFDAIVANVKKFITLRNQGNYFCKVHVRFIRNKLNASEWPKYCNYWKDFIDPNKGDAVVCIDVHNFAGNIDDSKLKMSGEEVDDSNGLCTDVFERISIRSNGEVILCCGDVNGFYQLGNVFEQDPVEIFNGPVFMHYRDMMRQGRITELKHCSACTVYKVRSHRLLDH